MYFAEFQLKVVEIFDYLRFLIFESSKLLESFLLTSSGAEKGAIFVHLLFKKKRTKEKFFRTSPEDLHQPQPLLHNKGLRTLS
jgi:hypothetical protein